MKVKLSITIAEQTNDKLTELMEMTGLAKSDLIRRAVEDYHTEQIRKQKLTAK